MSINYRKIYEKTYGAIPVDQFGRKFEIHHIDGDRQNNNLVNLMAVSIEDHYKIHEMQGDLAACLLIASKMKMDPKILSELARASAKKRVAENAHPFLGPNINKMLKETGRHPLVGPENNQTRMDNGSHHFLDEKWQKSKTKKQVEYRTHNLLKRDDGSSISLDRVNNGTHNLLGGQVTKNQLLSGKHPSQIKKLCPHCDKIFSSSPYARLHGNKCRGKNKNV